MPVTIGRLKRSLNVNTVTKVNALQHDTVFMECNFIFLQIIIIITCGFVLVNKIEKFLLSYDKNEIMLMMVMVMVMAGWWLCCSVQGSVIHDYKGSWA